MRSDTKIRNARPGDKPSRLYDERGLYLEISPGGGTLVAPEISVRRQREIAVDGHISQFGAQSRTR
jgi:hypothetical protein